MSSLSKIRGYFDSTIKNIDSSFSSHKDAFNDSNIANTNIDKSYWLTYSVDSSNIEQQMVEQQIGINIKFFFKGYNDTIKTFDNAMDKVNSITNACMSKTSVNAYRSIDDFPIQNIELVSAKPEQLNNNDNSMLIDVEFNATIFFNIC